MDGTGAPLSRRALLRGGGALGLALFVPFGRAGAAAATVAVPVGEDRPRFLDERELAILRGMVDRFIPGQPEDLEPGAVVAGCAEAIDALLAAFEVDPPLIYAGGPFSDRGGAQTNDFAEFVPLDDYEETAWRLRIEGSRGRPELEFNGPVVGFQQLYREGLAALDAAAPGGDFAGAPGPARELVLRTTQDEAILALIDVAFVHTLEFMYGAPEYGGNRDLIGWRITDYDGDVQPRGWTREEVEQADDAPLSSLLSELPLPREQLLPMLALTSAEQAHGMTSRSGGRLRGLQAEAAAIQRGQAEAADRRRSLTAAIEEIARLTGRTTDGR